MRLHISSIRLFWLAMCINFNGVVRFYDVVLAIDPGFSCPTSRRPGRTQTFRHDRRHAAIAIYGELMSLT